MIASSYHATKNVRISRVHCYFVKQEEPHKVPALPSSSYFSRSERRKLFEEAWSWSGAFSALKSGQRHGRVNPLFLVQFGGLIACKT